MDVNRDTARLSQHVIENTRAILQDVPPNRICERRSTSVRDSLERLSYGIEQNEPDSLKENPASGTTKVNVAPVEK